MGDRGVDAILLLPFLCPNVVKADMALLGELAHSGPSLAPVTEGVVAPPDWTDSGAVGSSRGPYEVGTTIILCLLFGIRWRWEGGGCLAEGGGGGGGGV